MKDRPRLQPEPSRPSPPWARAATMKEPATHRDEAHDERARVRVGVHVAQAPVVTGAAQVAAALTCLLLLSRCTPQPPSEPTPVGIDSGARAEEIERFIAPEVPAMANVLARILRPIGGSQ
jgi:hypothetical protein